MADNSRFRKILEPGYIGKLYMKNRMLKMGASPGEFYTADGTVPQSMKDYYEALARGGVALVTVAGGIIEDAPTGVEYSHFCFDDDKYIPSLKELAQAIQKHNCVAFVQLMGRGATRRGIDIGYESRAASALSQSELPLSQYIPTRELTVAEIEHLVERFAITAERFHQAGFQGIELNSANNHLLNSFLSLVWNKRKDAYGNSSLETRTRILVDIIHKIKERNGKDFVVIPMINGLEIGLEKGITIEESRGIARVLEAAGADAIHVRPHFYFKPGDPKERIHTEMPDIAMYPEVTFPMGNLVDTSRHGRGGWVPVAAKIKQAISVPVIAVGRLDAEFGEQAIRHGYIDYINLNRRNMADHDYANKIAAGKIDEIRVCTGCFTCFDSSEVNGPPKCMVNAGLGKEREFEIKPTAEKKKVMIVGGGPAGMEAARVSASRGHQVILFERQNKLGGSLPLAAMVKGFDREDFMGFVRYLTIQMTRLDVDVRLGKEVNRSIVEEIKPDVLVLATGGTHNVPDIPGINNHKVVTSKTLHNQLKGFLRFLGPQTINRLSHLWMPVGKKVVIMGGGIHGCQTAAFLVKRGRQVTIAENGASIGDGLLEMIIKPLLLQWLSDKGTAMLAGVKYQEITPEGLVITTREGLKQTLGADTILTALPLLPDSSLTKSLAGIVPEIYTIGDCRDPHLTIDAVADGARIGLRI